MRLLRDLLLCVVVAAIVLLPGCATRRNRSAKDAAIQVVQNTRYYQVDLLDPRTLSRAMWDMGIANESGVVGVTRTQYRWYFEAAQTGPNVCTIRSVRVTGELNIMLPRWTAPTGTSTERRQWWATYSSGVSSHENTHVSILKDYFREMIKTLEGMTGNDCARLRDQGDDILRRGAAAMQERQNEFDRTDRGIPIGYPPP